MQPLLSQGKRWPSACLVGYTNAGKSTLLNALSRANAYVDDRLFATLDTKTRLTRWADGTALLLSDTVGFIRDLPHELVASFRSTLEVAREANLIITVADAADPYVREHLDVVRDTLAEIKAADIPVLLVLNKCDRPEARTALAQLTAEFADALCVSALTGTGLTALRDAMHSTGVGGETPDLGPADSAAERVVQQI